MRAFFDQFVFAVEIFARVMLTLDLPQPDQFDSNLSRISCDENAKIAEFKLESLWLIPWTTINYVAR